MQYAHDLSYIDWVLDQTLAKLVSIEAEVTSLNFDDAVTATIDTPYRRYVIQVSVTHFAGHAVLDWLVHADSGEGQVDVYKDKRTSYLVDEDPYDKTPLYSTEPHKRDWLIACATVVGEKIGQAIKDDLYAFLPRLPEEGNHSDTSVVRFNAFSASLAVSRKHGTGFFLDLFKKVGASVPDLIVSDPVRPPDGRDFYLVFDLFSGDNKYTFTSTSSFADDAGGPFQDSRWYLTTDYIWEPEHEIVSPGYYSVIHNYTGKRLMNELDTFLVDAIRNSQGLPRLMRPIAKSALTGSQSDKDSKEVLYRPPTICSLLQENLKLTDLFAVPPGMKGREVIDTQVSAELLGAFQLTEQMDEITRETVREHLESQWVTFENLQFDKHKAEKNAGRWASEVWNLQYPEFDAIVKALSRPGHSSGGTLAAYTGCASIFGALLLLATGNFTALALTAFSYIGVKIYQKAVHRPAFKPSALLLRKNKILAELEINFRSEIASQYEQHVAKSYGANPVDWADSVNGRWQPLGPRPLMPPHGLTPAEAEAFTANYLRFLGFTGASTTRISKDGGVDVVSAKIFVQVKHQRGFVGVKVAREIFGVASASNRKAAVFTRIGFTKECVEFANSTGIALFSYDPVLKAHSELAQLIVDNGHLACDSKP